MSTNPAARTLVRPSFEAAFGEAAFIAAMLAFESALAASEAEEGLIPLASAAAIEKAVREVKIDAGRLVADGKQSASIAVPFVAALREAVALATPAAAPHVHFGATSQDVLDTAMVLCLRPCLDEADRSIAAAVASLAKRAAAHRDAPMLGRTLLQPALPITAGIKLARWALALESDRRAIARSRPALAVQFGGPVGTLDSLGSKGPAVRARLARRLGLADALAWHVHRNAWIELLECVARTVLTAGKIAGDIALLSQAEVGEMLESPPHEGVGASSSMPHKRNPVLCAHALAASARAPGLLATIHAGSLAQHERALGGWQAELATVPDLVGTLGSSLDFLDGIARSLVVDAARMRANLASLPGADAMFERNAAGLGTALDEILTALGGAHKPEK
jgi:3-carboxy-cis,cis-muconate cycloisomerase